MNHDSTHLKHAHSKFLLRAFLSGAVVALLLGGGLLWAGEGDGDLYTFQPGAPIRSSELNYNFTLHENKLAAQDAALAGLIDSLDRTPPPGTVVAFAGSSVPMGWVMCDGTEYDSTNVAYQRLFTAIGTTYGGTPGKFRVPHLGGRAVVGAGPASGLTTRTVGQFGGLERVALSESEMPAHAHSGTTSTNGDHYHQMSLWEDNWFQNGGGDTAIDNDSSGLSGTFYRDTDPAGSHNHTFTTSSTGSGVSHENMQPYLALNFIIKL